MGKKVFFVLGQPGIGKSKLVEEYIEQNYSYSLYFGTLDRNITKNSEIIFRHQIRRFQEKWDLFELTGDLIYDLTYLENKVKSMDAILIDGICNCLFSYYMNNYEILFIKNELLGFLNRLILNKLDVFIVDSVGPFNSIEFNEMLDTLHLEIINNLKIRK